MESSVNSVNPRYLKERFNRVAFCLVIYFSCKEKLSCAASKIIKPGKLAAVPNQVNREVSKVVSLKEILNEEQNK